MILMNSRGENVFPCRIPIWQTNKSVSFALAVTKVLVLSYRFLKTFVFYPIHVIPIGF